MSCPIEVWLSLRLVFPHDPGACVLGFLFILFCFLRGDHHPLVAHAAAGVVSYVLFYMQARPDRGHRAEGRCWGGWIILVAFVLRDMCLSGQLVAAYQRLTAAGLPLHG